jgi:hypothetical protein
MEKYVSENPEDPWLIMDKITISKCKKLECTHARTRAD